MAALGHDKMPIPLRRLFGAVTGGPAPGRAVAGGLVITLLLAALAFAAGKGVVAASYRTRAGNAWLGTTPRGSVTLVDGTSGRPSAEIVLPGTAGHRLQISQDGDHILVYDPGTGVLTKIDSGRLTAGPARATVPGVRLVAGPKAAYLVDYDAGTAQRIDLSTLQNVGPSIRVPGRLGTAGVDAQGTLWLPRSDDGTVVPVTQAGPGTPVDVGGRGSTLAVSIVSGRPVVVDATKGRVSVVTGTGVAWAATLPGAGGDASLLAPATQAKSRLPLVDAAAGRLFVVDVDAHGVRSVPLDTGGNPHLDAPVVHGDAVYVPDEHSGSVLVYSMRHDRWEPSFPIGGTPGQIDTVTQDDAIYFNDTQGSHAVVVGGDGTPRPVDKYSPGRPGASRAPSAPTLPGDVPKSGVPTRPATAPGAPPSAPPTGPSRIPGSGGTPGPGRPHHGRPGVPPAPGSPDATPSESATPPPVTPPVTPPTGPVTPTAPQETPTSPQETPTTPEETPTTPQETPTTPPAVPRPGTPRDVAAAAQPGGSIRVSWSPPADAPKDVSYTVAYDGGGGSSGSVQTTSTTLTIDAARLVFLRSYRFTVTAQDSGGASDPATAQARSGGDGRSFSVDVSKTRTDPVNPCVDLPNCRATMRQDPTHTSAATGEAPQGSTVTGFCHKSGQSIGDDDGVRSTEWVLIEHGGERGYVSTLWLGGANAYQSVWPCP
ncbi:fibronectin type III domain-containing protein [Actinoallomurus rhizosphaericola]|uniref:fibronectin type III domain-containing protein n=1 Tax=Actinoallomurus rhizosphaericola TaxID=2952536 RepID=UPI00209341B9|nr:hypothetical protein [Actinoallomurus rhizosphaericola]MCO5995347.1 hypothetical protein [Actinoallomurus rhizosphaericola]